jgi:hypothetical protein
MKKSWMKKSWMKKEKIVVYFGEQQNGLELKQEAWKYYKSCIFIILLKTFPTHRHLSNTYFFWTT